MAGNNWLLNDTLPPGLAQEFAAPASANTWTLNDTVPNSLGMTFAAPASEWTGSYWGLFEVAFNAAEAAGGGATIALTGVASGVSAVGSLLATFACGLVNVAGTGQVGAVAAGLSSLLTGYAGTGAAGTLGVQSSVALVGATSGTSAVGTMVPGVSTVVALSGVQASTAIGIEVPTDSATPLSVSATGAVGTIVPSISVALTGYAGTGAVGKAGIQLTLIGVSGAGTLGSFGVQLDKALAGATSGTCAVGTLGVSLATEVALIGVFATGQVGINGSGDTVGLPAVFGTGTLGALGVGLSLGLTGYSGTGAAGLVAVQVEVVLTGVAGSAAVGSLVIVGPVTLALTGVEAQGAVGALTAQGAQPQIISGGGFAFGAKWEGIKKLREARTSVTLELSGVGAAGRAGRLLPGHRATLVVEPSRRRPRLPLPPTSLELLAAAIAQEESSASAPSVTVALSGVQAQAVLGSVTSEITVALSGVTAKGTAADLSPKEQLLAAVIPLRVVPRPASAPEIGVVAPVVPPPQQASVTVALVGVGAAGEVGLIEPFDADEFVFVLELLLAA